MDSIIIHLKKELKNIRKTVHNLQTTDTLDCLKAELKQLEQEINQLTDDDDNEVYQITLMDLNEVFLENCADELGYDSVDALVKENGGYTSVVGKAIFRS